VQLDEARRFGRCSCGSTVIAAAAHTDRPRVPRPAGREDLRDPSATIDAEIDVIVRRLKRLEVELAADFDRGLATYRELDDIERRHHAARWSIAHGREALQLRVVALGDGSLGAKDA
jgi:hypothetical protein